MPAGRARMPARDMSGFGCGPSFVRGADQLRARFKAPGVFGTVGVPQQSGVSLQGQHHVRMTISLARFLHLQQVLIQRFGLCIAALFMIKCGGIVQGADEQGMTGSQRPRRIHCQGELSRDLCLGWRKRRRCGRPRRRGTSGGTAVKYAGPRDHQARRTRKGNESRRGPHEQRNAQTAGSE